MAGHKTSVVLFLVLALFLTSAPIANAQVLINEFDSWSASGDWVELYAFEDVDISGWIIRDRAETIVAKIPPNTTIGPSFSSFLIIEAGNRLNKDGDIVKLLKDDDSTLIDQIPYGDQGGVCSSGEGQSIGRYPDANSTIERFKAPSKNLTNNQSVLLPCPTNTPIPTATFTPTPKPTKTPTPQPTTAPTATPTVSFVKTTTPPPLKDDEPKILGFGDEGESGGSNTGTVENLAPNETSDIGNSSGDISSKKKAPLSAFFLILAGIGLIGISILPILKKKFKNYNLKNEIADS